MKVVKKYVQQKYDESQIQVGLPLEDDRRGGPELGPGGVAFNQLIRAEVAAKIQVPEKL